MASIFPAYVSSGQDRGSAVSEFTPSVVAGEVLRVGELWYYDTATQTAKRCGADPALIAGLSEVVSESARVITPDGKIPLRTLFTDCVIAMCSSTTPAETHRGVAYGVELANNVWKVDTSDTSNTRLIVRDINITLGIFYVQFIAGNLQFDAIAS